MYVVLYTVTATGYNDENVNGLVHYSFTSALETETDPALAAFWKEDQYIHLCMPDDEIIEIHPDSRNDSDYSSRYLCVRKLISMLKPGDQFCCVRLRDLGETAEEAEDIYFRVIKKKIPISFFDLCHIDSERLQLTPETAETYRNLICRIIETQYSLPDRLPGLSDLNLRQASLMSVSKKKSTH